MIIGARNLLQTLRFPLILLCLFMSACEEEEQTTEIVRQVRAMKVQDVEGFVQRYFPGRSAATQEINSAFHVAGQLLKRPIEIGVETKKGELIAALDPSTFQAKVNHANAGLLSSKAIHKKALLELDRQTKLFEKGWVAETRVEVVQAAATSASASVIAAEATLELAELDLSYTTLMAPFDGVVVDIYVENFQEVLARQPIARIIDTSQIEFWISIPESLIYLAPHVRDITVEFDAFPGQPLPAQIKEIKGEASETTSAYDVNLIMDQPESFSVLPGMAGKATAGRFDLSEELQIEAYEVPLAAIHNPEGDKDFLWIVDEASMTVSLREIKTVEATARGMRVEGVKPGEWIVTAGVEYLREDQKVRFLN